MITVSAFKWVPDFAQGQVRDLRARWALEEAGLPYRTRLLGQGDQDKPDYRALQPFGQVPILEDGGFALFESGAIVLYVGERSETLLPKDPQARARATQWLIAALNSIEPFVMDVARIDIFYRDQEWAKLRRPGAVEFAQRRLTALSKSLGDKPYLDGDRFTAGDLMMTTVLRILKHTDIVTSDKRLAAYVERCTARPAFKRALDFAARRLQARGVTVDGPTWSIHARVGKRQTFAFQFGGTDSMSQSPIQKILPFLWYAKEAEEAARFYASVFPDSRVDSVAPMNADFPERARRLGQGRQLHPVRPEVHGHDRRPAPRVQRCDLVHGELHLAGRDRSLLERDPRKWWKRAGLRLDHRQVGGALADRADRARGDDGEPR